MTEVAGAQGPDPDDRVPDDEDGLVTLDDELGIGGTDALDLPTLRHLLHDTGVDDEAVTRAEETGTLGFFAIERFAVPDPARYDLVEIAELTGMPAQQITLMWRSLGLPEPRPGDRIFTQVDVEMLGTVAGLMELGLVEPGPGHADEPGHRLVPGPGGRGHGRLHRGRPRGPRRRRPRAGRVRRHHAPDHDPGHRARVASPPADRGPEPHQPRAGLVGDPRGHRAVGFADLVGFTTLSQQVDEHTLASIVGRFEEIAYDTVTSFGGRVVKMIGDEVMYAIEDTTEAVLVGLALAEEYAAEEALSDVRVGIACGPVVEREADLYGPVVNLASRIVNIAFPGSVLTTDEVHEAVGDDPRLAWKSLKPRKIKDIGRVPLWAVRPAEDDDRAGPRAEVRERRTEAREKRLADLDEGRGRSRRARRHRHDEDADADGADEAPDDGDEAVGDGSVEGAVEDPGDAPVDGGGR